MIVENYTWYGFGFPITFSELPAVELHGELVPDVDWSKVSEYFVRYICVEQIYSLSGNQVKFIRGHLGMSLRDFAKLLGVKHQSVMRWEKKGKAPANIDSHLELVVRTIVVRRLGSGESVHKKLFDKFEVSKVYNAKYKTLPNLSINKVDSELALGIDRNLSAWRESKPKCWVGERQKLSQRVMTAAVEYQFDVENEVSTGTQTMDEVYQVGPSYYAGNN